ncbi:MAG: hypothetical protein WBH77_09895 [Saccharofermentanales bacterium]
MAEKYFPMLSIDGDRAYSDKDFANFFTMIFRDGVFISSGQGLRVRANPSGGMSVLIGTGQALLRGYQYANTTEMNVSIGVASSMQNRTDSIVIQHNVANREIKIVVKQGDITVERSDGIWELQLARIYVPKNTSSITADLITDRRAESSVCGYSTPFEEVSIAGIEEQYTALFDAWFQNLQDQLDDNQAGNLQNQITNLSATVNSNKESSDVAILNLNTSMAQANQAIVQNKQSSDAAIQQVVGDLTDLTGVVNSNKESSDVAILSLNTSMAQANQAIVQNKQSSDAAIQQVNQRVNTTNANLAAANQAIVSNHEYATNKINEINNENLPTIYQALATHTAQISAVSGQEIAPTWDGSGTYGSRVAKYYPLENKVYIHLMYEHGTAVTSQLLCTLPDDYRPPYARFLPLAEQGGGRVVISTDGKVNAYVSTARNRFSVAGDIYI